MLCRGTYERNASPSFFAWLWQILPENIHNQRRRHAQRAEGRSTRSHKGCELSLNVKGSLCISISVGFLVSLHIKTKNPDAYTFLVIPRARKVHQSLLTTPSTALLSVTKSFYQVALASSHRKGQFADVLVLNGPGTCLTLCLAVYLNKVSFMDKIKINYQGVVVFRSGIAQNGVYRVICPGADSITVWKATSFFGWQASYLEYWSYIVKSHSSFH